MNWSPDDPGAGEVAGIRYLSRIRAEKAAAVRDAARQVRQVGRDAAAGSRWTGKTRDAFVASAEDALPDLSTIANGLEVQAAALLQYAGQVDQIQSRQAMLTASRSSAVNALARYQRLLSTVGPGFLPQAIPVPGGSRVNPNDDPATAARRQQLWAHIDSANASLRAVEVQWAELSTWRRAADAACARDLDSPTVFGALARIQNWSLAGMSSTDLMALLGTLSATDAEILLANNPSIAARFWDTPPEATSVAAWWKSLSVVEKDALILGAGAVIGNLGGIDYTSRIQANMNQLDAAKRDRDSLTATQRDALDQITAALAFGSAAARKNRGLIDLNLSAHAPLAAIGIGDLDRAQKVTWAVPGMDTNVQGSMIDWTKVAQNIYAEQGRADSGSSHAVVAWIGYETPDAADSEANVGGVNSVWENGLAQHGALRLGAELTGFQATRSAEAGPAPALSVVAHSYGTTTSAYALNSLPFPVSSATFVASAGIDSSVIPNAAALNIATVDGHVQLYSTQASMDVIATTGRIDPADINVDTVNSPGAPFVPLGPDNYRVNPNAAFGAIHFGSNGGTDPSTGVSYLRTTGHDALGAPIVPVIPAWTSHGYFDLGTESLRDVALSSTGHGSSITVLTR